MSKKFRIAIAGASGYAGAELVRLAAGHPYFEITAVTSEKSAGQSVSAVFPSFKGIVEHRFEALAPETLAERADAIFLALPHTKSQDPAAVCIKAGKLVVDLSADYRLKDSPPTNNGIKLRIRTLSFYMTPCMDYRSSIERRLPRRSWSHRPDAIPLPQSSSWRRSSPKDSCNPIPS